MIIYDEIKVNKIKEAAPGGAINKDSSRKNNQQQGKNNSKKKKDSMNSKLSTKASILNSDQRNIQEKISQIQIKEVEIYEIENTLNIAKAEYIRAIQSHKSEESRQKIKVKQLTRGMQELECHSQVGNIKREHIQDDQKAIDVINQTIARINGIKSNLSKYKTQLIALDEMIRKNKSQIDKQQGEIQRQLAEIECIKEEVIINPIDFIFIQGDLNVGLIINIYV